MKYARPKHNKQTIQPSADEPTNREGGDKEWETKMKLTMWHWTIIFLIFYLEPSRLYPWINFKYNMLLDSPKMKNLTRILKTSAVATGLALSLTGCSDAEANNQNQNHYKIYKIGMRIPFEECKGLYDKPVSITAIESVDLDGDGDKDIIIGTDCGVIYLLENKIRQKQLGE